MGSRLAHLFVDVNEKTLKIKRESYRIHDAMLSEKASLVNVEIERVHRGKNRLKGSRKFSIKIIIILTERIKSL